MKTKTQHTPTPWRNINGAIFEVRKPGNVAIQYALAICGDINAPRNESGNLEANELSKANASFIVRAVNSHEALLEAIERVKIVRNSVAFVAAEAKGKLGYALDAVVEELNTAIAQAEGGK